MAHQLRAIAGKIVGRTCSDSTPEESKASARVCQGRRSFLLHLCVLSSGAVIGCTPLRILFKSYPSQYDNDEQLADSFLRAFVQTIIPDASQNEPNLTRIFSDQFYPFHKYRGYFVADLANRSQKLFQQERFDQLPLSKRTRVVQAGLDADSTTVRLYSGAIFMAQVSYFAGIYDDERGCPLIEFYGNESGYSDTGTNFINLRASLADELTVSGNYS